MFNVTFKGFNTQEQAMGFAEWFSGQGEQDSTICLWMGDDHLVITTTSIEQDQDGVICNVSID